MRKIAIQAFVVIFLVVVLAELVLRLTGKYATYSEANGRLYVSEYGRAMKSWYHLSPAGSVITSLAAEFNYSYTTNSEGIVDAAHSLIKPDSVLRMMVFGDSYTQGVGAPFDSTWPQLCAGLISSQTGKPVEIVSGAVAGSDAYFNYVLHRDKLRKYKCDVVIAAVNITDYSDILLRGDTTRFKSDGTTQFPPAPWYEPLYKHSRFLRAVLNKFAGFDLTGVFISTNTYRQQLPEINNGLVNILTKQQQLAQQDSAHFVVLLHCIPNEFIYANKLTALNTAAIKELSTQLRTKGVDVIDIHQPLQQQLAGKPQLEYTYKYDLHYNAAGYAIMARLVSDSLMIRLTGR